MQFGLDGSSELKFAGLSITELSYMHILFLADLAQPDAAGGAQTVAWELALKLGELGHQVSFVVTAAQVGQRDYEEVDGIKLFRLPQALSPWQQIQRRRKIVREINQKTPVSVVHSHFAYAELGVANLLPCAWVRTFHGAWDEEGWIEDSVDRSGWLVKARVKKYLRRCIELRSLSRAQRVLFLSEFSRMQLQRAKLKSGRMRLIPGGCDVERFYPLGTRNDARTRLGLTEDGPLLFSLRRLVPRMGLGRLIEAMANIRREIPGCRLIIGGRGPEADNLRKKIDHLGLQNQVTLAGFIPDEKLADYYRAADLFVLPTTAWEGFGLVTVDALSSGTPVLGTPAGATPELLTPLDKRLVTEGTTAADLAKGVLRFFGDRVGASLAPETLHSFVRAHYTWDLHTEEVMKSYHEALETVKPS